MPNHREVKMTGRGFEVTMGSRTCAFLSLEDALAFAQQRLEHAAALRQLKASID